MFFLLLEFCEIKCVYLFTVLYLLKIYYEGGGAWKPKSLLLKLPSALTELIFKVCLSQTV